ncbi:retropepsin-like aspartic protease family protein [Sphingomonas radiodurans]|uniref:retropepsin-like aspartic protease family protein n=1 Tax=Sphingomonas radiodurans TaxID=2890321 RepID=UPI001E2E35EB|nr:TIGR02281 family clan AA aspartic protease [Sphingomonas radiodurans]WBH16579.1 TIGR02281 family clan AA aspartic protease [Sphingomonas radiodurans]
MNDGAHAAMLAIMLILPLSALIARRLPLGPTLKMAAAWVAIFAVAAILVTQIDRFRSGSDDASTTRGQTVRITRDADGHYRVDARINGVMRRMMIDSGATTTALSSATAEAAGVNIEESTFPRLIDTANGQVSARTARIERMAVGSIETRDLPVVVSEAFGDQDLIGMNFLSRLGSWRVEGGTMIFTTLPDEN